MRRGLRPFTLLAAALWTAPTSAGEPAAALPTPYTAEQIRDAWQRGFSVVIRTRDAGGERFERLAVASWSPEGQVVRAGAVDSAGRPLGEQHDSPVTWEQLRQHASFPAARTTRERVHRDLALGSFDGWLYRVAGEDGTASEFFFGDATPGPPLQYGETREGQRISESEQISRGVAASEAERAQP
jgi:hypothetical protein